VPTRPPVDATLQTGTFTVLHTAFLQRCRVTITATSNPDAGGVGFRIKRVLGGRKVDTFIGDEAFLTPTQTFFGATIEATTPPGVASLDITYVVKTGADAL
jgi:hypothetical protein